MATPIYFLILHLKRVSKIKMVIFFFPSTPPTFRRWRQVAGASSGGGRRLAPLERASTLVIEYSNATRMQPRAPRNHSWSCMMREMNRAGSVRACANRGVGNRAGGAPTFGTRVLWLGKSVDRVHPQILYQRTKGGRLSRCVCDTCVCVCA